MGLWITLRRDRETSFFRQHLLNMASEQIRGDCLILASGYFQEDPNRDYSILGDRLLEKIQNNNKIKVIQAIGAKGSPAPFNVFCDKLDANWDGTLIRKKTKGNNWHAKIAMKLESGVNNSNGVEKIPVCAIIGSSNLTRPAFGISTDIPANVTSSLRFNYECDVLIFSNGWFDNNTADDAQPKFFPGFKNQDYGSIYFQNLPEGCPNELDQMKMLLKEIDEHIRK